MTVHSPSQHDTNPVFPPPADFTRNANAGADLYTQAAGDRLAFWAHQAEELFWTAPWNQVLDWSDAPTARWFTGGRLNVAYNCVDRHVEDGFGEQVAIHWVGERGDTRDLTYAWLKDEVSRTANALLSLGLVAGDRVVIQLPMIPEAVVAMLACARIGVVHSVVFGGFSPAALRSRIDDAAARVVITSDGQFRRGQAHPMKENVDEALHGQVTVEHVVVVRRTGTHVPMNAERDLWWDNVVAGQSSDHEPDAFDAEHPLFILYTSGTTGKPKGILHTTGGYLTQAAFTHRAVFDIKPDTDVYWCAADIGWITGHTYIVYGPLANRTTQVLYEGTPDTPDESRHFQIIEKYGVTIYYVAPTLIRTFMKWGDHVPAGHDLSSLRLLGSVGEPINPEAWLWFRATIGHDLTPIVDTWWQTETGAIMISPLPGVTSTKPGSAQTPLPGISARVVDDTGAQVADGQSGYLVIDQPWPSMARGIWGDPARFQDAYWDRFSEHGYYFAGDGARYDADGDIWMQGRVDDVMNVSGHRLSTAEIESALVSHPAVAEAAVIGAADALSGQSIFAYVVLRRGHPADTTDDLPGTLARHVASAIGPIARPKRVLLVPELPKTRSGKIIRRLLQDLAEGRDPGDTATLADPTIITAISNQLSTAAR